MAEPTFFEPGKTYIESKPFVAPEILEVFCCVAVAEHPAGRGMRAFGFSTNAFPGDNWISDARNEKEWGFGWGEYSNAETSGEH